MLRELSAVAGFIMAAAADLLPAVAGQLPGGDSLPNIAPFAAAGAAGLLTFVLVLVIRDNATARKERAKERDKERAILTAIHDRLHEDSRALNATLLEFGANCALAQERMTKRAAGREQGQ